MKFILEKKTRTESQLSSAVMLWKKIVTPLWAVLVKRFSCHYTYRISCYYIHNMQFYCIYHCKKSITFTSVDIITFFKYISFQYVRVLKRAASRCCNKPAVVMSGYRMVAGLTLQVIFWSDGYPRCLTITLIHTSSSELVTGSQVRLTSYVSSSQRNKETGL